MLFSSVTFLFTFLPLTLAVYYLCPKRGKNFVLLIASLIFYAWGEPVYVVLMILTILFNYVCGRDIYIKSGNKRKTRYSLVFAIAVNLFLLGFFKYYGFFIDLLNTVLPFAIRKREIGLPIGISFYIFQAISYLVDVYREEVKPQKNILHFALYISMFPQLIAGPIVRYVDIEAQLKRRAISLAKFGAGVRFFIIGLSKKVILANGIGAVFEAIRGEFSGGGNLSVIMAWLGALAYTLQIYFDFSGYSDMAVGLGKMFGFNLKKNFNYPYAATSITDFWRRWHISLSTWFREYVYIPLGGNRAGVARQICNLLVVWSLTGFWHGASWNFLLWGFYYGILLVMEKFIWGNGLQRIPKFFRRLYTLLIVVVGWVFFFSSNIKEAFSYLGMMFGIGASGFSGSVVIYVLSSNWLLWTVGILACVPILFKLFTRTKSAFFQKCFANIVYMLLFILSVSSLVTGSFNPFLYFKF